MDGLGAATIADDRRPRLGFLLAERRRRVIQQRQHGREAQRDEAVGGDIMHLLPAGFDREGLGVKPHGTCCLRR